MVVRYLSCLNTFLAVWKCQSSITLGIVNRSIFLCSVSLPTPDKDPSSYLGRYVSAVPLKTTTKLTHHYVASHFRVQGSCERSGVCVSCATQGGDLSSLVAHIFSLARCRYGRDVCVCVCVYVCIFFPVLRQCAQIVAEGEDLVVFSELVSHCKWRLISIASQTT